MAGLSSRFMKGGFTLPKYMLYVKEKSLFNLAVSSFEQYFDSCRFIFVARDVYDTPRFIEEECRLLGIKDYKIVVTRPTRGQAETVFKGIQEADILPNESILIFNIDTFRPAFSFPENIDKWDGYLECFVGSGVNWSYAETEDGSPDSKVIRTAEKNEISNYCSTGIYFFKKASDFINAYRESETSLIDGVKELYIAPLYNFLIREGKDIRVNIIRQDEVTFCGIPQEYIDYLKENL